MLFDTHAHINFKAYSEDGNEVIKRALDNNVWMINVGSQYSSSKRAVQYAQKYPKSVYAAIGLHPLHLEDVKVDVLEEDEFESRREALDIEKYKELSGNPKVVAIGEIGLDYYHIKNGKGVNPPTKIFGVGVKVELTGNKSGALIENTQKQIFSEQLKLAAEIDKPVIVHCRAAHDGMLNILGDKKKSYSNLRGVIHCFSGNLEQAKKYINLGFFIGFNGLITFARDWDEVIKKVNLDKILLETDCPYLTPVPFRGKRNEPMYVEYVARKIAEIKGIGFEEVAKQTTKNAKKMFGLPN